MFVRDYMTREPVTISPEASHSDATHLMREHAIRCLPVMHKGKLVGIVVEKDLVANQPSPATTLSVYEANALLAKLRIKQIMAHPVVTVQGDCPTEEAARIMIERRVGHLPVMEADRLVGIITEMDIFKALVEILGGLKQGLRLTVRLPERVGALAELAADIAKAGGNIFATTSAKIVEGQSCEMTLKEAGADMDVLKILLQKGGIEVLDLRLNTSYEPHLFG